MELVVVAFLCIIYPVLIYKMGEVGSPMSVLRPVELLISREEKMVKEGGESYSNT